MNSLTTSNGFFKVSKYWKLLVCTSRETYKFSQESDKKFTGKH